MKEYPFIGVIRAPNLTCLDPADVPGVAADPFADLARRAPDGGGELTLRQGAAKLTEDVVENRGLAVGPGRG